MVKLESTLSLPFPVEIPAPRSAVTEQPDYWLPPARTSTCLGRTRIPEKLMGPQGSGNQFLYQQDCGPKFRFWRARFGRPWTRLSGWLSRLNTENLCTIDWIEKMSRVGVQVASTVCYGTRGKTNKLLARSWLHSTIFNSFPPCCQQIRQGDEGQKLSRSL